MGILYQIVNIKTGLRYIGVTSNRLKQRWCNHLWRLRRGLGVNKLQLAYDEYGEDAFIIEKIDEGKLSDMYLKEKELTKETVINGYNTIIGGGDTDERKASYNVFRIKKLNNPEFSKLIGEKISKSLLGHEVKESTKEIWRKQRKGKSFSEKFKQDRSVQYSGKGNPNYGKYVLYLNLNTGIYYETPELLSHLGIAYPTLVNYIRNKNPKVSSFIKA